MGQELNKLKKHKIISIVLMAIGALILLSGIALTAVIASPINSVEVTEMMNGQEVKTTKQISTFAFLINTLPNYQLSTLGYLQITGAAAGLVVGIVLLALGATFFVKTRRKTNEMLAALQDAEEEEVGQEEQAEENVEATPTQQTEVKTEQLIGTQLVTADVASTQAAGTEEVQGDLLPPSQQRTGMRPAPLPKGSPKLLGPNQAGHPQHGPRPMNAHPGQPRPQQAGPRPMGAGGSNQPRPMPNGQQNPQDPRPTNPKGDPRPQPAGPQNSQPHSMPNNPQGPRPMGAPNPQPRPQQAGPRPMGAGGSNQPRPMPNGPQNQQGQRPMNPQGNPRPQPAGVRPNSLQANRPGPRPTSNNPQGPRPMGPRPNGGPNRA